MNIDFHYYGTYAAARLAGWAEDEAVLIAHAAQYVDDCEKKRLTYVDNPVPTAQSIISLAVHDILWDEPFQREVTRVWPVFHFLPGNYDREGHPVRPYHGALEHSSTLSDWAWDTTSGKQYQYVCLANAPIAVDMVNGLADLNGQPHYLHAVGLTMHVLADTWAHMHYAGLPAWFMNAGSISDRLPEPLFSTTDRHDDPCWQADDGVALSGPAERDDDTEPDEDLQLWKELLKQERTGQDKDAPAPAPADATDKKSAAHGSREDMLVYWERILDEEGRIKSPDLSFHRDMLGMEDVLACNSYLFLGHSRSKHTPDYPYQVYDYLPQWNAGAPRPNALRKDNPVDFRLAFLQMTHALRCIRAGEAFAAGEYDPITTHNDGILRSILTGAVSENIQAQSACWRRLMGRMRVGEHQAMEVPELYDKKAWAREVRNAHDAGGDVNGTHAAKFNRAARSHLDRVRAFLGRHGIDLDAAPI